MPASPGDGRWPGGQLHTSLIPFPTVNWRPATRTRSSQGVCQQVPKDKHSEFRVPEKILLTQPSIFLTPSMFSTDPSSDSTRNARSALSACSGT
eukprot:924194-Rhodomonas_salina.2